VLMDYMLPGITAAQVMEILRRECPGIKVVCMTAHSLVDNVAARLPVDGKIAKPFDTDALVSLINGCLKQD